MIRIAVHDRIFFYITAVVVACGNAETSGINIKNFVDPIITNPEIGIVIINGWLTKHLHWYEMFFFTGEYTNTCNNNNGCGQELFRFLFLV